MSMKIMNELEWYNGHDIPNPSTGSFLILTKDGGIAEAEYKNDHWLQYRWGSTHKDVIAWCRLSDIKLPEEYFLIRYEC